MGVEQVLTRPLESPLPPRASLCSEKQPRLSPFVFTELFFFLYLILLSLSFNETLYFANILSTGQRGALRTGMLTAFRTRIVYSVSGSR